MIIQKIILGTVQFGLNYGISNKSGQPSESSVLAILDYAATNGITTLDTADAYGNASEIIGKYNKINPGKFLINTKFVHNELTLSEQLEESLNRLHVDNINVYHLHNYNDILRYPSISDELTNLKINGAIGKVGVSVYDNEELKAAIGSNLVDVIQFPFNLLDNRSHRGDLMILAKGRGKELHVRSVFLQGLFFKSLNDIPHKLAPLKPYLQKLHDLTRENHLSIEQIALMYTNQQTEIDQIIIGVDSLEQLKRNLTMGLLNITPETCNTINQIIVKETELLYPRNWN